MDRNYMRGPLHKLFDLEKKNARQAEARLSLRLQRLEVICLYHVKSLAREQRLLQKQLTRLQQAYISKKSFSSYLGNGILKRSKDAVTVSPQTGQRHIVQEPNIRAMKSSITQEVQTKPPVNALRRQEHLQFQRDGTSCYQGENPQGGDRKSASPRKGSDPNKDVFAPWYNHEAFANRTEGSSVASVDGESEPASAHSKTRSKNANRKPHGDARAQSVASSLEHSGSSKGEGTKPTLVDLYAKVKNAHYLRHRVPPESERLLSVREIFGHSDSPPTKAGGEM
ncbi:coiled-coil domain-containing protein 190 [Psammomys obesus]|uniref:coiled-coil domain-containing protein 190 n=1 Tax=Psammomys obesus TaxID=48139 RepID=UPI00245287E4|nr:coiled-coil domain-containing protein 190 [Psammomys obesus]XP_055480534.1 coiled-coil domain-containing protein 190 [Psammomys obesus]XP_055480535.1 coiled-coil domain-containing protein 190 [Psammomys obesus]XP_055480536.1 coiled-coil domain-containing protein 190 [Psammomys obesus]